MRVRVRQAWQQKHPTPSHAGWDFHWHPRELPGAATNVRADEAVAVWSIGPHHAVWLRGFQAIAPAEQRRYVGWAGCAAEPIDGERWAQGLPNALSRLSLPAARPFGDGDVAHESVVEVPPGAPAVETGEEALVRSLWLGGEVAVADPHDPTLPAQLGSLLAWLPPAERVRPRTGALTRAAAAAQMSPGLRNLVHYLHRSWRTGARRPWQLVLELAAAEDVALPDLFAELTRVASAWERPADLMSHLVDSETLTADERAQASKRAPAPILAASVADAGRLWNRVLHYWGRGFFGRGKSATGERLARVLARRVVCDHLLALDQPGSCDPHRYLRRLRFEATLTARDVRLLRGALLERLPSLEVQRERA